MKLFFFKTLNDEQQLAGPGVAPARPHIAQALLNAGHVATFREAFDKYIGNDGPAYARYFQT